MSKDNLEPISFINKIVNHITELGLDMEHLSLIVPSDRAANQLRVQIAKTLSIPILAPNIQTIDKWMKPDGIMIVDETRQLLCLHEVCKKFQDIPNDSFEEFLSWGKIALKDFNEIDRYLLDPILVFKNLASIKELESWQIDEASYSESQKKFQSFWKILPEMYVSFNEALERRGQMTSGRAYKKFAEDRQEYLSPTAQNYFIFAGFNALSKAELVSINKIVAVKKGSFLSETDTFYIKDTLHEAGSFHRKNHDFIGISYNPKPS